ncbi:MAG: hypothetical protein NVSMB27_32160 [Ktedonobacteraceae bacterium]
MNPIAELIVQLGDKAEGTAHAVAGQSSLDGYRLATFYGNGHIDTLSIALPDFGKFARYASAQASELKDADTAANFTEIGRLRQCRSPSLASACRCGAPAHRSRIDAVGRCGRSSTSPHLDRPLASAIR